ncbi:MAG: cation-translocating P-type ATPase [Myxococcales bacterium]|nr:cation-translocating P-type ATPase [Myxococcales bacterium]
MNSEPSAEAQERVPCATCRTPVDPLRAPFVAVIAEQYRFYCSRECRERGRPDGERPSVVGRAARVYRPSVVEVTDMLGLARASLPTEVVHGEQAGARSLRETPRATRAVVDEPVDPIPPAVAITAAALAALVASIGVLPHLARVLLVGVAAVAGIVVDARGLLRRFRDPDAVGRAIGLLGALLPWLTAIRASGPAVVEALRDSAVLAAVTPVAVWAVMARRIAGRQGLDALGRALPTMAEVLRPLSAGESTIGVDGAEATERVEAARLRAGAVVVVGAGAVVAVDGVVRQGEAEIRPWPGATLTRRAAPGDAVLAGAKVLGGTLQVQATRAGEEVAWARLARLLGDDRGGPRSIYLARRVGELLPYGALGLAVLTGAVRALLGSDDALRATACILSLSPAAMIASAVELPFVDALVAAAQRGIVFRDAGSVEAAARVGTVALCLRRTVTVGRPEVTDIVALGDREEREILEAVAAAEDVAGDDPIARAVLRAVRERGWRLESVRRPTVVPGLGITAVTSAGQSLVVGDRRLLLAEGVSVGPVEDLVASIEGACRTAILVALEGRVEGAVGLDDPVREEARSAVQSMIDAGYDVALLGGASRATVEAIGALLDVTNLRPEVLPEERPAVVRALSEVGHGVAVVGRPAEDGMALAAADVGISIEAAGAMGGDTGVALASDDLRDAAAALAMARTARERAWTVLAVGLGGAAVAAFAAALIPSWGMLGVLLAVVVVLVGEALVLRGPAVAARKVGP